MIQIPDFYQLYLIKERMGTNISTQTMNAVNGCISDISQDIESKCSQTEGSNQVINIKVGNITGCGVNVSNIGQNVNATFNSTCKQTSVSTTDIQNILTNNLAAFQKTVSQAFTFTANVNTAIQNVKNFIDDELNLKNIVEAISEQLSAQTTNFTAGNITCFPLIIDGKVVPGTDTFNVSNLTQTMITTAVATALQSNTTLVSLVTNVDNQLKATSDITANGIAQIVGAVVGSIFVIIGVIILIIYLAGRGVTSPFGSSKSSPAPLVATRHFGSIKSTMRNIKIPPIPRVLLLGLILVTNIIFMGFIGHKNNQYKTPTTEYILYETFTILLFIISFILVMTDNRRSSFSLFIIEVILFCVFIHLYPSKF
jgi:hypothetical protein